MGFSYALVIVIILYRVNSISLYTVTGNRDRRGRIGTASIIYNVFYQLKNAQSRGKTLRETLRMMSVKLKMTSFREYRDILVTILSMTNKHKSWCSDIQRLLLSSSS